MPRLYLVDDAAARALRPFALTRPAGELRVGALTQRERAERLSGIPCAGHVADATLAGFDEPDAAAVVAADAVPRGAATLLMNARGVPDWAARAELRSLVEGGRSGMLTLAGEPWAAYVAENDSAVLDRLLQAWTGDAASDDAGLAASDVAGRWIRAIWDLVAVSPDQTGRDVEALAGGSSPLPDGAHRIGGGDVVLGKDVSVEPGTVFDTRHGPIWLRGRIEVRAFARITGPTAVDHGSILLGGVYDAVSLGPVSRFHGEVEETVGLGYSNKAHDGFLGHAYVGRWVNLGALTTNSDLKNNYGPVRLQLEDGEVDTGLTKLGCFLGDHAKTGIGTMLNTGTIVGPGSNLFGSEMPPKRVPPFVWGGGSSWATYDVERFVATARTVMGRRDVTLSGSQETLLRDAWRRTAREREQA